MRVVQFAVSKNQSASGRMVTRSVSSAEAVQAVMRRVVLISILSAILPLAAEADPQRLQNIKQRPVGIGKCQTRNRLDAPDRIGLI